MKKKSENKDTTREPLATYQAPSRVAKNPNNLLVKTEQEFKEYFENIEQGNFLNLDEANEQFEEWKKNYLKRL